MIILGAPGPQVHCDGSAQKMNPPQKIALFGKMAPRGPPWAPENGAPWAPWAPQGPRPPRAPWGVVILATRMIILTTRMIILMLYQRPAHGVLCEPTVTHGTYATPHFPLFPLVLLRDGS